MACSQVSVSNRLSKTTDSSPPPIQPSDNTDCTTWDFHYLITLDHQMSSAFRKIEVFMEPEAFSEANLKRLFRYLSDKNPVAEDSKNNLLISVATDWKQLGFPSDCPPSGSSGGRNGDPIPYHWARFYRRGGKEFFTFNPDLKADDKDVIMKGTEIFRNGVWQKPF
ncbi:MAG TPA: hypothetical protein PLK77_19340 [Pyrinomonadaceae bacterium]|nr:hypothetical protein [Pyrinomonadaceae bacterium]